MYLCMAICKQNQNPKTSKYETNLFYLINRVGYNNWLMGFWFYGSLLITPNVKYHYSDIYHVVKKIRSFLCVLFF